MNPSKVISESVVSQLILEEHCTLTLKVGEFSKVCIHKTGIPGRFLEFNASSDYFSNNYPSGVYPNGHDVSSKGFVSVAFHQCLQYVKRSKSVELSCTISILDAEGCKRFPRSFVICKEIWISNPKIKNPHFIVDRYVSRDFLLKEGAELLPNDTLTLHVEVILRERELLDDKELSDQILAESLKWESDLCFYMKLDSPFAKILSEESNFFDRVSVTEMIESRTKRLKIPVEEVCSFQLIARILLDIPVPVYSVYEIFNLYATADKYNIQRVLDACRCWLKLVRLTREEALSFSEFAELYNDDCLREITKAILKNCGTEEGSVNIIDDLQRSDNGSRLRAPEGIDSGPKTAAKQQMQGLIDIYISLIELVYSSNEEFFCNMNSDEQCKREIAKALSKRAESKKGSVITEDDFQSTANGSKAQYHEGIYSGPAEADSPDVTLLKFFDIYSRFLELGRPTTEETSKFSEYGDVNSDLQCLAEITRALSTTVRSEEGSVITKNDFHQSAKGNREWTFEYFKGIDSGTYFLFKYRTNDDEKSNFKEDEAKTQSDFLDFYS